MERTLFSWWFAKRLAYLTVATVLFACFLGAILASARDSGGSPAWAVPGSMTIRRVSSMTGAQGTPVLLDNLDCDLMTYRMTSESSMRSGCFTDTAFGFMDSDDYTVIFNGTDEGLSLLPYTAHQILVPWPKAIDLISLQPVSTGGALIGLYKNPLGVLQDQRNALGKMTAKKLAMPPDLTLKDTSGSPLVINPQTVAFSDGGSWLIAETLSGSFVRINLATLSMTAFAPAYGSQGSPGLLQSRVAVSEDGRFIAIANNIAEAYKVYDLTTCDGVVNNLRPQICKSYDYHPFSVQQIKGLRSIRRVRFVNESLISFEVLSTDPSSAGEYELAPAGSITSLTDYIGLGDSYTSGEGAFDYLAGTDGPDNMCHLSRNSYPLLLTDDLFGRSGGHSVACSGAVISDISSTGGDYRGQVRGVASLKQLQQSEPLLLESVETNFIPGYVAQQRFVKRWQPGTTTVLIGGNDVGFGDLLQNCVEPHISRHISDNTCYSTYEDRLELTRLIDRTVPRWTALYARLRREAPETRLYAIGYPQIAVDDGNCALNVQLNKSELQFAESMVDYLNGDIRKAAADASISYIDISQALKGHRLCETAGYNVAVNGLTAGQDTGGLGIKVLGKESYHPNTLGQALIEQAILKQTRNLSNPGTIGDLNGNSDESDTAASLPLMGAPKTGRAVYMLIRDNHLTAGAGKRGSSTVVRANGAADGLQPGAAFVVRLDGPLGKVLGTITSNSVGDIDGSVVIPGDTVPGGHTLDITSQNENGEPIDITQPFYVSASDDDSDEDGIDDITDSCPGAINSGKDSDRDGVDDICDSLIGPSTGLETLSSSSGPITIEGGHSSSLEQSRETTMTKPRSGQVLGTTTSHPNTPSAHTAKQALKVKARLHTSRQVHKTIHWLTWLVPAIILLLLLMLAWKYISKRRGFDYNE